MKKLVSNPYPLSILVSPSPMFSACAIFLLQLINLYLEAYHSVYDKKEKEKLAQVGTLLYIEL